AFRVCTALVDRWRERHRYADRIEYVFDRLSEGRQDVDALFHALLPGGPDALRRYGVYEGCWSFQNKARVVQLQAADIWAWENYRCERMTVAGIESTAPVFNHSEGTKTVILQLKNPVGMVEGFSFSAQRHWLIERHLRLA